MSVFGQFWQRVTPVQLKRMLAAVLALALAPLSVALVTQQGDGEGGSGGGWQSPASIFAARSPGRRDDALVFWVKKRLADGARSRAISPPRDRVLPVTRARAPARVAFQPDAPFDLLDAPVDVLAPGGMLGFAPPIPAFTAPGFDGLFDLPPSPSLSRGVDEAPTLPPSPAVPELATWLQTALAIATLGLAMRRRGPQTCASHGCSATRSVDCPSYHDFTRAGPPKTIALSMYASPSSTRARS